MSFPLCSLLIIFGCFLLSTHFLSSVRSSKVKRAKSFEGGAHPACYLQWTIDSFIVFMINIERRSTIFPHNSDTSKRSQVARRSLYQGSQAANHQWQERYTQSFFQLYLARRLQCHAWHKENIGQQRNEFNTLLHLALCLLSFYGLSVILSFNLSRSPLSALTICRSPLLSSSPWLNHCSMLV